MLGTVGGREQMRSRKGLPGTGLPEGKAHTRLESGFSSEGTGELSKNVEQRSNTVSINLNARLCTNSPQHLANQWHTPDDPWVPHKSLRFASPGPSP